MQSKRLASVNGLFYPDNCSKISSYFKKFSANIKEDIKIKDIVSRAIIVPHAGYIYSGFTANMLILILHYLREL